MRCNPDEILAKASEQGASDVHFTVNLPPLVRARGQWAPVGEEKLRSADCDMVATHLLGKERMALLRQKKEYDLCYSIEGVGRYRVNVFLQQGHIGVAVRVLPSRVPDFRDLGLPVSTMQQLCQSPNGIVLICGPTGSGKSTTLAAMVDHINRSSVRHIVTIEDPVEFLHEHDKSIVEQREVGADTLGFAEAMRHVLRQSPDVVLIGEIRDPETMRTGLMIAETGHLVLSTIHTGEVVQGLSRIVDMYPQEQQAEIRVTMSLVIRAMIVQHLLPGQKEKALVLACEVMLANAAIRNLIREGKFEQIYNQIHTRQKEGMRTMNGSLLQLWRAGDISRDTAMAISANPMELRTLMEHA